MANSVIVALREARALIAGAKTAEPGEAAVARRITRDLDQALARLEGRDGEKDLISIVCHDLKDPLASIVMGTGFLRKTIAPEDGAARRVVDAIARSADRMSQVVGDFHDLAKLEMASLVVDARPCDVVAVVRGAMGPLEAQAHEKGVVLDVELPEAPVAARVDRAKLQQMVVKLVGNAIKFTGPEGRVTVRVRVEDTAVRLSVTDTGRGIPPERLATIFDHSANAKRTPRDGPGLGLAIVKGLAELQGGTVTVDSRVNEGSTFTITLPAA